MNLIYLKLLPYVLLAALSYFLYQQVQSNALLKRDIETINSVIDSERQAAQESANRQLARAIEEEKRDEEHQRLVNCVAAGTCGIRMRYQACPSVPATGNGGSQAAEAATITDRQFQQAILDHRKLAREYEARVTDLQFELKKCAGNLHKYRASL